MPLPNPISISRLQIPLASSVKILFFFEVIADTSRSTAAMEMKKIACAVLVAAASMSAVLADGHEHSPAPAPGPSSGASAGLPVVGSMVGASLVSLLAYYLQWIYQDIHEESGSFDLLTYSSDLSFLNCSVLIGFTFIYFLSRILGRVFSCPMWIIWDEGNKRAFWCILYIRLCILFQTLPSFLFFFHCNAVTPLYNKQIDKYKEIDSHTNNFVPKVLLGTLKTMYMNGKISCKGLCSWRMDKEEGS